MLKFLIPFSIILASCGAELNSFDKGNDDVPTGQEQSLGLCSSSGANTITCTDGNDYILPADFPYVGDCNNCIGTLVDGVVKVKCPNNWNFEFPSVKGDKGDKGDNGSKGDKGDKGDTGSKGNDGKDGLNGKDGKDGKDGNDGVGCTVGKNHLGQAVITCGNTTTVLNGCGGYGCWSFGAKGNVYRLPVNTSTLPNFTPMTPVAVATVDNFDVANRQSSLGMPYTYTPAFADKEWYGIRFDGFIEIKPVVGNKVCFKLTSDDGARFSLQGGSVEVVALPNLQPPTSKVGCILAAPGWHAYRLDWFQGPKTQVALKLEVSYDNSVTYTVVPKTDLKFNLQ